MNDFQNKLNELGIYELIIKIDNGWYGRPLFDKDKDQLHLLMRLIGNPTRHHAGHYYFPEEVQENAIESALEFERKSGEEEDFEVPSFSEALWIIYNELVTNFENKWKEEMDNLINQINGADYIYFFPKSDFYQALPEWEQKIFDAAIGNSIGTNEYGAWIEDGVLDGRKAQDTFVSWYPLGTGALKDVFQDYCVDAIGDEWWEPNHFWIGDILDEYDYDGSAKDFVDNSIYSPKILVEFSKKEPEKFDFYCQKFEKLKDFVKDVETELVNLENDFEKE